MGLGTPFDLVSDGLSAQFSSPGDPSAFSIQSRDTTFLVLSTFSGKYLYQNGVSRTSLQIRFNRPMAAVNLDFATLEYHGPGNVDTPSSIKLNAYLDSTMSTPLGTTTARGTLVGDTYPQGKLTFSSSGQAFNVVTIEILFVANGATAFLIDNILATPAA
jgi:hypothetical protein